MCDEHITLYFVKKTLVCKYDKAKFPAKKMSLQGRMAWYLNMRKTGLNIRK